ncbi:hypothetical protein JDW19_05810 [Paenibacillus polymyxa]|uniref:Uncharacterized protein n=1 Tax=Paenibacillus polymyxa TaxID=1406 RepID=A0A8I1IT94_PAEPO|nr:MULTISPECIES: hypothetical protein [Paenibacillus]KAF6569468.1 hypothetical protein G9G53_21830 [Paenibacillus sp. EKM206P]KAF6590016.1 hypothetical protein G9G52_04535 [Paenibacillus sp. EKM205P]MBM0632643.1 hypothetical protein [Paenibacillus polymyxa]
MNENIYVAEYLMKAHELEKQHRSQSVWKWSHANSKKSRLFFDFILPKPVQSSICCAPCC